MIGFHDVTSRYVFESSSSLLFWSPECLPLDLCSFRFVPQFSGCKLGSQKRGACAAGILCQQLLLFFLCYRNRWFMNVNLLVVAPSCMKPKSISNRAPFLCYDRQSESITRREIMNRKIYP